MRSEGPMRSGLGRLGCLVVILSLIVITAGPASALTFDEERQLGREFFSYIKKNTKIVDDPSIQSYINGLGHKILSAAGPQPFEYRFFIIDNDVLNAFAAPAGYVFVHSGVINTLQSEGQLAAIISHEISHVTSRHLSERLAQNQKMSIATMGAVMAGVFLGGPAGQALVMGSMAGNIQMQLAYSRNDEREADTRGLDLLVEAGYDPIFMLESFQLLLQNEWHALKDVPTYLTTHPGLPERISSIERAVHMHPGYGEVKGRGDDKAFQAAKIRNLALLSDPLRAQNQFNGMLAKNPQDPQAHYGLALLYRQQQNYERAVSEFKRALETDPANPAILTDLGALLFQMQDVQGAMSALGRAVVLRPNWPQTLFYLARIYEEQDAPDRAQELFERVLLQDPQHPDALYHLGLLYGRKGDLAQAHLHTGLYFKTQDKRKEAMYHLRKAQEAAKSTSPELLERIQRVLDELAKEKDPDVQRTSP